jgi:hypothetical protein
LPRDRADRARQNRSIGPAHLFPAQAAPTGAKPGFMTETISNEERKMSREITTPPSGAGGFDEDGFAFGSSSGRGHDFLRWNAENKWIDRDGCEAPSPLLAVKVEEILRMWKGDRKTDMTTKPLPNPDELNAAIPESEWEKDRDGKPRPPWAHHVAIQLVDPKTATKYVFCAATTGAHIAFEQLRENVATMRMLRNARVMPLVKLSSRPMKTKYKMSERPHFEIIGWHAPGDGGNALAPTTAPQLPGPASADVPPAEIEALQTQPNERKDDPISGGLRPQPQRQEKHPIKPKSPINAVLNTMDEVKPATSAEILDDDIPW